MKELGYVDTYHLTNCSIENPPDSLMWMDALAAKYDGEGEPFTRADWDQLLGGAQAVCDLPSIAFAQELISTYPDAKVVLINCDVDSWHESMMRTVYWRANDPELKWLSRHDWAAGMYYPVLKKLFDCFFEGDFTNKGKEIFQRHYAEVRSLVPREKLLEYRVTEGWEPLCQFLEQPVPKGIPFPKINEEVDFVASSRRRNRNQMENCVVRWTLQGVVSIIMVIGTWRLLIMYGVLE